MEKEMKRIAVLLVDDEEEFLAATERVLRRRDFEVFTARGGREAIDLLGRRKVDVVILDMKMPGMDGTAVFDEIRHIWPDLPVIVLTGHDSLTQAFEMSRRGVVDYVFKPCDIEELALKIRRAAGSETAKSGEDDPDGGGSLEGVRVLLVDDEVPFLNTMKKVLERRKMQVLVAERGESALAVLEGAGVDVVVLDVKMPGMDGLEVLDRIMAAPVYREVILLTGHPTVDAAVKGMKKGAFEYLVKPPDVEELVRTIGRACRRLKERCEEDRRKTVDDILRRYPD